MFWIAIFALGAAFGPAFLSETRSNLDVPPGTPSALATAAFDRLYPAAGSWPPAFVVQRSTNGSDVLAPPNATLAVASALASFAADHPGVVDRVTGYWELVSDPSLVLLAESALSPSRRTLLSTVSWVPSATLTSVTDCVGKLLPFAESLSTPSVAVSTTGIFPLFSEVSATTESDFALIDAIVLPVAVVILGVRLQSFAHMGVALANLALTILLTFALLNPLAAPGVADIAPFAPSIMLSLGISVCFDYSLFTLTRFREEVTARRRHNETAHPAAAVSSVVHSIESVAEGNAKEPIKLVEADQSSNVAAGANRQRRCTGPHCVCCCGGPGDLLSVDDLEEAVFAMLAGAGHVVLLSGATLACTFILLLAFKQNFLQSVGYACGFVVIVAIIVNLTLTPALLLVLPCLSVFSSLPYDKLTLSDCRMRFFTGVSRVSTASNASIPNIKVTVPAVEEARSTTVIASTQTSSRSFWFKFAWAVTGPRSRWVVLAATALVTIPFLITVLKLVPTSDDTLIYLQGSSTLNTLHAIQSDFPIGALDPYEVIADTGVPGGVLTPAYYAAESALVAQILATQGSYVNAESFTGLSFFRGANVTFETGSAWLNASSTTYNSSAAGAYRALAASKISATGSATLLTIETTVNPNSQVVVGFVEGMRSLLAAYESGPPSPPLPLQLYLFGAYTTTLDVQNALFKLVPVQIGVVVAIVLIIVGAAFGSIGLTIRLVATVGISLCWTFGLVVLVYQPGTAQDAFAVLTPSLRESSGVYWVIPVMSFSILVGLALDYDIFLVSRLVEFRKAGWSDRAAVCLAVERTGGIITAAGLIMAVSFCGLLAPPLVVLNQYGFALFIGVVFDTFVMRPIVVPAIVTVLGSGWLGSARVNWWPRQMPEPTLSPLDEEKALLRGYWLPEEPFEASAVA